MPRLSAAEGPTPAASSAQAHVEVLMPQMGVSVAEGTIVAWHKRVGDWVNAEETLCEISTDKIDIDVPSPASGRVVEIAVDVEQTVPVGSVLALIATDAVAGDAHPDEGLAAGDGVAMPGKPHAAGTAGPAAQEPVTESAHKHEWTHYSPVVQRIAESEGIDLSRVPGRGRGGRVRKQDVVAFIEEQRPAQPRRAEPQPLPEPQPLHIESPYREQAGNVGTAAPQSPAAGGEGAERLSRMRRSIAQHMLHSLKTAAHCTSIVEVDMSCVETERRALALTYLPFVARSVIDALRAHPLLNATLEGESLTRHRDVNLGVAVSLGEDGLIVPVIHRAQELSCEGLATQISELARRARAGELSPDEVRGGTFTITNPGGYGTLVSTPIINQPQVAILDLEAVVRRPVVITDAAGRESIAIRPMAHLCLSWDHRALDGALAAQFLGTVRTRIESWGGA
jgi:pyruvate/2-oxoglutarate dehydrogenase complex dihydrolipoamide acyltransferase (E2) component